MTEEKKEKQNNELERYQQERDECLDKWKRERADFLNYKKEEARKMEEFVRFANEDLLMEIIEVLDDLLTARKNAPTENIGWLKGLDNTMRKFDELLKKYGVEKIIVSENFDPAFHEAVEMEENGERLEEIKPGYMMRGKVIRPAKVKIIN